MLNKTILMGRLTADPELRRTQNNTSVTSFTLAVDRDYKSQNGDKETDFIDVVAWRFTADFVAKWFKKGMLVAVAGRIQTRSYEDRQGNKRKAVEVVAEEVHFAEPKRESQPQSNNYRNTAPAPSSLPFDFGSGVDEFRELSDDDGELPF